MSVHKDYWESDRTCDIRKCAKYCWPFSWPKLPSRPQTTPWFIQFLYFHNNLYISEAIIPLKMYFYGNAILECADLFAPRTKLTNEAIDIYFDQTHSLSTPYFLSRFQSVQKQLNLGANLQIQFQFLHPRKALKNNSISVGDTKLSDIS